MYKKLRNEITSDVRKAKASYFQEKLNEVKTTGEYWNLLNKATHPKIRNTIGPLKRHDDSLAVDDTEKANMMNMHNIMLLWFVKIYERNLKKLQFTTQRFDTPV